MYSKGREKSIIKQEFEAKWGKKIVLKKTKLMNNYLKEKVSIRKMHKKVGYIRPKTVKITEAKKLLS